MLSKDEYNKLEGITIDNEEVRNETIGIMAMCNKGFMDRLITDGIPEEDACNIMMNTNLNKSNCITNISVLAIKITNEADNLAVIWLAHKSLGFSDGVSTMITCRLAAGMI